MSLKNNRAVFERLRFKTRTLVDVSKRNQDTTIFGVKHKMPLVIAPTGTAGLMWFEGELALARAAQGRRHPVYAGHGLDDRHGARRRGSGRRALVPALHVARSLALPRTGRSAPRRPATRRWWSRWTACPPATANTTSATASRFRSRSPRAMCSTWCTHPRWLFGTMMRYLVTTGMPMYANYPAAAKAKMTRGPMGRSSLRTDSHQLGRSRRVAQDLAA